MGWSFTHRPAGIDSRKWVEDNLTTDLWNIVDFVAKRDAYYFVADKNDETRERVLFVVGVQRVPRAHFNFGWKTCDEGMGPVWAQCPDRLLNLMGEAPNEYAAQWRAACRAFNARPKVVKGTTIRVPNPIQFSNGGEYDTFVYSGRGSIFEAVDVVNGYGYPLRVKVGGWKSLPYEVVT